jgi:hypothetical protein
VAGRRHHVFVASITGTIRSRSLGDYRPGNRRQRDRVHARQPIDRVRFSRDSSTSPRTTNNDVPAVSVTGGVPSKLTPSRCRRGPLHRHGPVIVRAQRRPGFESDRWYLDVIDRATKTKRTIFETPDLSVSEYVLSHDGRDIFFTASDRGTDNLYRVPLAGGTPALVTKGGGVPRDQCRRFVDRLFEGVTHRARGTLPRRGQRRQRAEPDT